MKPFYFLKNIDAVWHVICKYKGQYYSASAFYEYQNAKTQLNWLIRNHSEQPLNINIRILITKENCERFGIK